MDGLARFVLHLEVAHEVDHVLQEVEGKGNLWAVFDDLLDLGDRVLGGEAVHQQADRLEQLALV